MLALGFLKRVQAVSWRDLLGRSRGVDLDVELDLGKIRLEVCLLQLMTGSFWIRLRMAKVEIGPQFPMRSSPRGIRYQAC